jgi:hypothetical protein
MGTLFSRFRDQEGLLRRSVRADTVRWNKKDCPSRAVLYNGPAQPLEVARISQGVDPTLTNSAIV